MILLVTIFDNIDLARQCMNYLEFYWICQIYESFLLSFVSPRKRPFFFIQEFQLKRFLDQIPRNHPRQHQFIHFLNSITRIHTGYVNPALEYQQLSNSTKQSHLRELLHYIRPQIESCVIFLPNSVQSKCLPFTHAEDIYSLITSLFDDFFTHTKQVSAVKEPSLTHLTLAIQADNPYSPCAYLADPIDNYIRASLLARNLGSLEYLCLDYGSDHPRYKANDGESGYIKLPPVSDPHFSILQSLREHCPLLKRADISPQLTINDCIVFLSPDFRWESIQELEIYTLFQRMYYILIVEKDDGVLSHIPQLLPPEMNQNGEESLELDLFASFNTHKFPSVHTLEIYVPDRGVLLVMFQFFMRIFRQYKSFHDFDFVGDQVKVLLIDQFYGSNQMSALVQQRFHRYFHHFDSCDSYADIDELENNDHITQQWLELFAFTKEYPMLSSPHLDELCLFPILANVIFAQDLPIRFFMLFLNNYSSSDKEVVSRQQRLSIEVREALCSEFFLFLEHLYPSGRWKIINVSISFDHHRLLPGIQREICTYREYSLHSNTNHDNMVTDEDEDWNAPLVSRANKQANFISFYEYLSKDFIPTEFLCGESYLSKEYLIDAALLYEEDLIGIPKKDPTRKSYYEKHPNQYKGILQDLYFIQEQCRGCHNFFVLNHTISYLSRCQIPIIWLNPDLLEVLSTFLTEKVEQHLSEAGDRSHPFFELSLCYSRYEIFLLEEHRVLLQLLELLAPVVSNSPLRLSIIFECLTYSKWHQLKTHYIELYRQKIEEKGIKNIMIRCKFSSESFLL